MCGIFRVNSIRMTEVTFVIFFVVVFRFAEKLNTIQFVNPVVLPFLEIGFDNLNYAKTHSTHTHAHVSRTRINRF